MFEEGFGANVTVCQFDGTIMTSYGLDEEAARYMFGFLPDEKGFDWNKEIYQRENIISDPGDLSCPNAPRDATAPTIDGLAIVVCPKCGHSVLFSFEHD